MIRSFADTATADIFNGDDTRAARTIPKSVWGAARRKLDILNAANDLRDLRAPPANRLEALKGDLIGRHSIRVNDQYRLVFVWKGGGADEVQICDYH
jgi:proteic killer suppression protein